MFMTEMVYTLRPGSVHCLKFYVQYPVVSNADSLGGACRLCRFADWNSISLAVSVCH